MNDFDTRLAARLERLDAAVPAPRPPVSQVPTRHEPRARNRGRVVVLLVAASVVLASVGALVATGAQTPPTPAEYAQSQADETRVRDDLARAFAGLCLSEPEAKALIRHRLDALGYREWTIRSDDRVREAPCIGSAPIGDVHEVLLMPSMGGDVATALDAIWDDLMSRCATPKQALDLVRSTLIRLGRTNANVQVGPARGIPAVDGDAFVKHMADGCAVYGGAQFDNVGRYTWFVSTN